MARLAVFCEVLASQRKAYPVCKLPVIARLVC